MGRPASLAEIPHLVIERLPVSGQHVLTGDDDINFLSPIPDRSLNLLELQIMGNESRRKSGGNGSNRNAAALKRINRCRHKTVINTDGTRVNCPLAKSQLFKNVFADGLFCLRAKAAHPGRRVVTAERRQINAGHSFQKPCSLGIFFYGTPSRQARHPALRSRKVNAHILNPSGIKGNAPITRRMGNGKYVSLGHSPS